LKFVLPHPGPLAVFARELHLPAFLHFSAPLMLHFPTPYSFPSGHMLRATFLVALVSIYQPRWHTRGWFLILAMAFTRVYGNDHWLSDVLGGALLGWSLALLAIAWDRRGNEAPGHVSPCQDTHLRRESLSTMLSERGSPVLSSLYAILDALALPLTVVRKEAA
jgi:membrane-associated phospholipid phosphatase